MGEEGGVKGWVREGRVREGEEGRGGGEGGREGQRQGRRQKLNQLVQQPHYLVY